ncbi:MAG: type II toxin-antitoxin system PemK/MazF family toxin [Spirochaetaceae bacterium]|nr:MAG: type II toxin-antitoxin system PemK/MazF family toxin [Spirochaetaceae bacterium]
MIVRRGEVWWASLPEPQGSGPGFRRPVVVVQADPFNRSRVRTVIVASVTTNQSLAEAPGNVGLDESDTGLPHPSVVNVSQLLTIDKAYLDEQVGSLSADRMHEIDAGLRLVLSL